LGIPQGYLASRRNPWYSQEKRDPAPFLCTYMGRPGANGKPFRFFWNQSQAVAANVYLSLYPRGSLKHALSLKPELFPVVHSILLGLRPDQLIDNGRVYGGGLHKLEPKELANLPADDLSNAIEATPSRNQMRLPF
jgi:adenine-specific DNA-methyltransferase